METSSGSCAGTRQGRRKGGGVGLNKRERSRSAGVKTSGEEEEGGMSSPNVEEEVKGRQKHKIAVTAFRLPQRDLFSSCQGFLLLSF